MKFNFGRYLEAAQNAGFFITNNPIGRLSTTSTRTWTDADRDYVVDCDLLSQRAQSPAITGSIDSCGQGNLNFGTDVFSSTLDPTLTGSAVILFDPIFQGLAISLMAGEVASLLLSRVTVPVLYFMSHHRRQTAVPGWSGVVPRGI